MLAGIGYQSTSCEVLYVHPLGEVIVHELTVELPQEPGELTVADAVGLLLGEIVAPGAKLHEPV